MNLKQIFFSRTDMQQNQFGFFAEPPPMLVDKYVDQKGSVLLQSAGVALEVHLKITQAGMHAKDPPCLWNLTRSAKMGFQWPKKELISSKHLWKNLLFFCLIIKSILVRVLLPRESGYFIENSRNDFSVLKTNSMNLKILSKYIQNNTENPWHYISSATELPVRSTSIKSMSKTHPSGSKSNC